MLFGCFSRCLGPARALRRMGGRRCYSIGERFGWASVSQAFEVLAYDVTPPSLGRNAEYFRPGWKRSRSTPIGATQMPRRTLGPREAWINSPAVCSETV